APHTRFGADWRPAPVRFTQGRDGAWRARVPAGRYRIIAKVEGQWHTVGTHEVPSGRGATEVKIEKPGATAVEFLVQRRG
ncbi:MAG: hypothetical protein ACK4NQ_01090, partial [Fimbriimonadaceae bacterium]